MVHITKEERCMSMPSNILIFTQKSILLDKTLQKYTHFFFYYYRHLVDLTVMMKLMEFLTFVDFQSMDRAIMPQLKVMYTALAYYCSRCSPEEGQQKMNLQKVLICINTLRWHYQIERLMSSINIYCQ